MLSTPVLPGAPGPKFRRKLPDATNSPYFNLDRHLIPKYVSGRKRLLDDLNDSGSPFVTTPEEQPRNPVANFKALRNKGSSRLTSVEGRDIFGMSPLKKNVRGGSGDIEIIDSTSTTNLHQSKVRDDDDESSPVPRAAKQLGIKVNSHDRPALSSGVKRASRFDNRSLSGRKRPINSLRREESTLALQESPRSTSADALRNTISRMKL